jgi:hypothetical protein
LVLDAPPCKIPNVRGAFAVLVLVLGLTGAVTVVAVASPAATGLPGYTAGYPQWKKLNRTPITGGSAAHAGVKNVYASRPRAASGRFPNGAVVVKTISQPGAKGPPGQVAVMRKVAGRWRWVEYVLTGSRYGVIAQGQLCVSCHMQARKTDWVFTKR